MAWKRLITFIAEEDHGQYTGEPIDGSLDIGKAYSHGIPIRARILPPAVTIFDADATPSSEERTVKVLLPAVSASQVGVPRLLGANFVKPGQDAAEAKSARSKLPSLFYKPPETLSGPERSISIPRATAENGSETSYEVELVSPAPRADLTLKYEYEYSNICSGAQLTFSLQSLLVPLSLFQGVVLSRPCRDITASQAPSYILGYILTNDVSWRKRSTLISQWGLAKSFEGSLILSPVLVNASEIKDPESVQLKTDVDGEVRQEGNTRDHLWRVFETIEELSKGTTLPAGTLISMGSPVDLKPEKPLQHGQVVVVQGSHGLGSLRNVVRQEGLRPMFKPPGAKAKL